jgi:hypothetical protein
MKVQEKIYEAYAKILGPNYLNEEHDLSKITYADIDRALARDSWKGLDKVGKGLPQGLSWSPLVSTHVVEAILKFAGRHAISKKYGITHFNKDNILMYVDDGLIFSNSEKGIRKLVNVFIKAMKAIGVEVSKEKSRTVKYNGEFIQQKTKFLGLEYDASTDTIWSKTRTGTSKRVTTFTKEGWEKAVLENPEIPYFKRTEIDTLGNTISTILGAEQGYLGCLIAEAWNPKDIGPLEKRLEISEGKRKAWMRITSACQDPTKEYREGIEGGFIWKFQDLHPVNLSLTNVSSVATHLFLTSRTIRERGMRQHSRTRRQQKSIKQVRRITQGMRIN